jgi:hypothetical protein
MNITINKNLICILLLTSMFGTTTAVINKANQIEFLEESIAREKIIKDWHNTEFGKFLGLTEQLRDYNDGTMSHGRGIINDYKLVKNGRHPELLTNPFREKEDGSSWFSHYSFKTWPPSLPSDKPLETLNRDNNKEALSYYFASNKRKALCGRGVELTALVIGATRYAIQRKIGLMIPALFVVGSHLVIENNFKNFVFASKMRKEQEKHQTDYLVKNKLIYFQEQKLNKLKQTSDE